MRRALVVAVVVAVAGVACTSGNHRGCGPGRRAVNATTAPLLPTDVAALPDFTFPRLKTLLRQLRGTPVVVNVWGSWCGPCREEGPRLAAAARADGRRVQFLGVDIRDTKSGACSFIRQMGWTYPSVFDPSPRGDILTALGYLGAPATVFYDRAGRRVDQHTGPVTAADLDAGITRIRR